MEFTSVDLISLSLGFVASSVVLAPLVITVLSRHRQRAALLQQELDTMRQQTQFLQQQQLESLQKQQELLEKSAQHREIAQHFRTRAEGLDKHNQQLLQQWHEAQQAIRSLQQDNQELEVDLHGLRNTLALKEQAFNDQLAQLEESKQQLKQEFNLLANQIFEEKAQKFNALSQQSIEQLLKPVQGELKGFRDKMELIHTEELKQRAALRTELLHLQANNKAITEQAERLTTALQGQKKTQGNWGELMLENVLDSAGLRLGQDYQREVSFNTDEGRFRPDVIVYLPEQRHLVIDAKTSLNAYTRYVNAETELAAKQALLDHVNAVSDRINELADKSYHTLPGLNSPEVMILFMPIESAFVEALKCRPELYQQALERNILVATPTTLLTSLNIIKQLWRFEAQSHYARELAQRAERFYTKLNSFLVSMEGVGKQLDKAKESYDKAFSQLYAGKANLIKQASEFKELGVSVNKELPAESLEKAQLELD
ncbi:DNA recombination protein RmuC [Pseudoalteromonas fenneropenaei]|uniref:DNA recombination protein RmuC n=1 Tax=Pseudoalteromonas fenneropenaei TaxID=1737459 RepID=A0ABV7CIU2_9GAMM